MGTESLSFGAESSSQSTAPVRQQKRRGLPHRRIDICIALLGISALHDVLEIDVPTPFPNPGTKAHALFDGAVRREVDQTARGIFERQVGLAQNRRGVTGECSLQRKQRRLMGAWHQRNLRRVRVWNSRSMSPASRFKAALSTRSTLSRLRNRARGTSQNIGTVCRPVPLASARLLLERA